jgi:hypothetical protein
MPGVSRSRSARRMRSSKSSIAWRAWPRSRPRRRPGRREGRRRGGDQPASLRISAGASSIRRRRWPVRKSHPAALVPWRSCEFRRRPWPRRNGASRADRRARPARPRPMLAQRRALDPALRSPVAVEQADPAQSGDVEDIVAAFPGDRLVDVAERKPEGRRSRDPRPARAGPVTSWRRAPGRSGAGSPRRRPRRADG